MYYKKLVAEQVYLSPMDIEQEVESMTKWVNEDEEIAYFNGFYDRALGKDKVLEMMQKWNEGSFGFSIVNKETNAFMGHISFFNQDHHEEFITMGIYLGKEYRHKGYGKQAMQLAIRYLFDSQRFEAIHLEVYGYNTHAMEMYKNMGFVECGRWHKAKYHMGKAYDIVLMELLREDFM